MSLKLDALVRTVRAGTTILDQQPAQIVTPSDIAVAMLGGLIIYKLYLPATTDGVRTDVKQNDVCFILSWDGHAVDPAKPHTLSGVRDAGRDAPWAPPGQGQAHIRADLGDLSE